MRKWFLYLLIFQGLGVAKAQSLHGRKGLGAKPVSHAACISGPEHQRLLDSLHQVPVRFEKRISSGPIRLGWPLRRVPGFKGKDYYGISNFFDHNPSPFALRDFRCGNRTYDFPGYNHNGTDIFLWPAFWRMMQEEQVDVVAAETGVIVLKTDGNFDQQCVWTNANWNVVVIRHADTLSTLYGHLKKNSLTTKAVGDTVEKGEYLGKVGSSGRSNGPHLHFEAIRSGVSVDPYTGSCQTNASRWVEQRPYFDPFINRFETSAGEPVFPPCPQPEDLRSKDTFALGDTLFVTAYFRDLRVGDSVRIRLEDQTGTGIDSLLELVDFPEGFFDAAWWTWWFLPGSQFSGPMQFQIDYKGRRDTAAFFRFNPSQARGKQKSRSFRIHWHSENRLSIEPFHPNNRITLWDMIGRNHVLVPKEGGTYTLPAGQTLRWIRVESGERMEAFPVWPGGF